MAVYKMMYWRPDAASAPVGVPEEASEANFKTLATRLVTRYCNVHYLIGYNQASLADFREMAEELRKTFPEAKDKDIGCSKVTKSSYCQGFTIITWSAELPAGDYPGWQQVDTGKMEYYWA